MWGKVDKLSSPRQCNHKKLRIRHAARKKRKHDSDTQMTERDGQRDRVRDRER